MYIKKKPSLLKIRLTILIFVTCFFYGGPAYCIEPLSLKKIAPPDKIVTLYVHVKPIDSGLAIEAELPSEKKSFNVPAFPAAKVKSFMDLMEPNKHEYSKVAPILEQYGHTFFDPIQTLLSRCTEIEFVLADDSLIAHPFDLLIFQGKHLFLQKPIAYSFNNVGPQRFDLNDVTTSLLVSDETADPQRAVMKVREYIPNSTYKDINDVKAEEFASMGPVDLLLMSAHGHTFADREDYIELDEEQQLKAEHMAGLKPKFIYFDSCYMGSSIDFIKLFRSQKTAFYIAPVVPNEAGNSSTKTMCLFFKALDLYKSPTYALYLTRCQLYEHFLRKEINFMLLFRSFPFRVYRL